MRNKITTEVSESGLKVIVDHFPNSKQCYQVSYNPTKNSLIHLTEEVIDELIGVLTEAKKVRRKAVKKS